MGKRGKEGGRSKGWEGGKEFYNDKSANLSRTYSSLIEYAFINKALLIFLKHIMLGRKYSGWL